MDPPGEMVSTESRVPKAKRGPPANQDGEGKREVLENQV